jgi:hypothetical protein
MGAQEIGQAREVNRAGDGCAPDLWRGTWGRRGLRGPWRGRERDLTSPSDTRYTEDRFSSPLDSIFSIHDRRRDSGGQGELLSCSSSACSFAAGGGRQRREAEGQLAGPRHARRGSGATRYAAVGSPSPQAQPHCRSPAPSGRLERAWQRAPLF